MPNVLVIDDDASIRAILQYRLRREKFSVRLASNGLEAFKEVNAQRPDVIILDIMMPRMDGLQFLAALRADLETSRIPVIILTALGHGIRKSMRNLRAFTIISKPFSPQLLMEEVREAMMVAKKYKPPLLAEERHA